MLNNRLKYVVEFTPKPWYYDTVLAIDSTVAINGAGTFTDHNGVSCISGNHAFASGGSAPLIGNDLAFKYGKGIRILKGAYFAAIAGAIPRAMFAQSWTLDWWFKDETTSAANVRPGVHPFTAYPNTTGNDAANRLLIGPSPGGTGNPPVTNWALWNNNANLRVASSIPHQMKGIEWQHFVIEYDSVDGVTSVYKNGERQGNMNYRIVAVPVNHQVGVAALGTGPISVIERYRLRTGVRFGGNYNLADLYY